MNKGLLNSLLTPCWDGFCCWAIVNFLSPLLHLFSLLYLMSSERNDSFLPVDFSRPSINVLFAVNEMHTRSIGSFCTCFTLTLQMSDSLCSFQWFPKFTRGYPDKPSHCVVQGEGAGPVAGRQTLPPPGEICVRTRVPWSSGLSLNGGWEWGMDSSWVSCV